MTKVDIHSPNLAINGGTPVRKKNWLDNFTTGKEEKEAVIRVMDSKYLSLFEGSHTPDPPFSFYGGPEVQALEQEWSEYYDISHSISMNSATSCIYASIGALGIGYGDEVIVSPYTMTACALAPLIYGAIPVFADVERDSGSLDPNSIRKKISKKTKAIIVVHQFGIPANMNEIMNIAKESNLYVIEDCAQAHGAKYKNKFVGTIGDIGVFSLNVNKTIQSGEGGICTTNNKDLSYRLQLIRNHGEAVVEKAGYKKITNIAGYNYRMNEIEAAIAREQLKKLSHLNKQRLLFVKKLTEGIQNIDFIKPLSSRSECLSTYYIFPILYFDKIAGVTRDEFVRAMNAEGALFYQGYVKPLYLQPLYQNKILYKHGYPFKAPVNDDTYQNYSKGLCINCEKLHFSEIIINEHIRPPNNERDIDDLIEIINKVAKKK